MKPFFCFFGGKWRLAPYYPPPEHKVIVEPFAGAAGYSTRHAHHKVMLYDVDPILVGVWDYIIRTKSAEIMKLPVKLKHVDEVKACQEAKWLIGFWLDKGNTRPAYRPSPRMCKTDTPMRAWAHRPKSHWGVEIRERIAAQVDLVKHWKVKQAAFLDVPDREATWYVDPPYQTAGTAYRFGSKQIQYEALAEFVKSRSGFVIACENDGAKWLPFSPFMSGKSTHKGGKRVNHEVIYTQRNGRRVIERRTA